MAKKNEVKGEVVYDASEEDKQKRKQSNSRTEVTMDDIMSNNSNYINLGIGEEAEMTIARIDKVQDSQYCLSNTDYKIEIKDDSGAILSITAHKLWGMTKQAIRDAREELELENPKGLNLKIEHPDRGDYRVSWYHPDKEEYIEVKSNDK